MPDREYDNSFPALSDPTYHIQSVLGSGGVGVVYKAWHERLQKPVVIKQITGEGKFDPEIRRIEVDILKNLRHSCLPQIYDFITEEDYFGGIKEVYTVMEFISGQSLDDILKEGWRFPQQQVVGWARQLCSALVYLHGQTPPVLHSDIKPANIMLTESGDICLIDFNVSLLLHEGAAQALGRSQGYASPEQYGQEGLDVRSDVYSLGATLYHLLTGEKPGIATDPDDITPLDDFDLGLSEGVIYVVEKCMEPEPDLRFQTAAQLSDAVDGIFMHDRRWKRQRLTHILTVALLIFVIAASCITAALGYFRIGDEKESKYNGFVLDIGRMADVEGFGDSGSIFAYNEAIALYPEKVAAYFARSRALFETGQYDECIGFIRDFIATWASYSFSDEDNTRLGDIYYMLAGCYFEREDFANAAQYFETALRYNRSNPEYTRDLAIALVRLGRAVEARDCLDELTHSQYGGGSADLLRGEIAYAQADYEEAVSWFLKALEAADSDNIRKRAYLICANALGRLPDRVTEEIELLTTARRDLPGQIMITERLADAYVRAARNGGPDSIACLEQAVALFDEILARGLVTAQTWFNIGVLYQEIGDFPEARAVYTNMLSDYPNDYRVPMRLAYLTFAEQNGLPNEDRDYRDTYEWYVSANALYANRPGGAGDDAEMLTLGILIADLRANGWIE